MSAKHTPGPWIFEASTQTIRSVPTNYWLATMDSWDAAVNHKANAHLIAAAPELLAALEALKEWGCTYTGPRDANSPHALLVAAHAAIAKAKGGAK